ncbi:MAG: hypothetical protein QW797_09210 [Thermoproteota archaeon]
MPDKQEIVNEKPKKSVSTLSKLKSIFMILINPRTALLRIKDSPIIILMFIIPLILIGLKSLQFYTLLKVKLAVPPVFFTQQMDSLLNTLFFDTVKYYSSFIFFGFLMALIIFMVGTWRGGLGGWRNGMSAIGYVYMPNAVGLAIITVLLLSLPTVQTSVVTTIGNPNVSKAGTNIAVNMKNYTGEDANLTIAIYAEYKIPLSANKSEGGIITRETVLNGLIDFTYTFKTLTGFNITTQTVRLDNISISHTTPIVVDKVEFNRDENCTDNCIRKLMVNMVLFLNNTYTSPVPENMSIPYIITLNVYKADSSMETHVVSSSFYTEIMQFPDFQPLSNTMSSYNLLMTFITIVVNVWHFFLFANAVKIIHDFGWSKSLIFTGAYIVSRLFIGFGI